MSQNYFTGVFSAQKRGSRGLFVLATTLLASCSGPKSNQSKKPQATFEGLSGPELTQLASTPEGQQVLVVDSNGNTKTIAVTPTNIEKVQAELAADAKANGIESRTVVLNSVVKIDRELEPEKPNAGLLFSGKQEFGIDEWLKKFPEADGRGVVAGVVDDGVAPLRSGLLTTSNGLNKVMLSLNNSSLWRVPLEKQSCVRKDVQDLSATLKTWRADSTNIPLPSAENLTPFYLTNCGTHPQMAMGIQCSDWSEFFPKKTLEAATTPDGVVKFAAAVSKSDAETYNVFIDWNADGILTPNETTQVKKGAANLLKMESGATAFVFSWVDAAQSMTSQDALMSPTICDGGIANAVSELHVRPPESQNTSGAHGEGVASVLAGHALPGASAQATFDGVAPGARIVDVQLTLDRDIPYSIQSIGQALRIAGLNSDVVNLSYSLYFSTPASQISMKRYLDAVLKDTKALYFFSGGNNGPGRGSMNRKGLYPTHSVVSGAYLNAAMSQSVFGSAIPWGGVVTYSSRGPGPDGSIPVDVLSPLAATTASTADGGFRDFSGTSSASPAMAGFSSLLLSGIRQAGLEFDREVLKKSIIESAVALKDTPAIDQGAGLPNLTKAFELYKKMTSEKWMETHPTLATGNVFIKDLSGKKPAYLLNITPQFSNSVAESVKANYTEQLKLEANSTWILAPKDLILARTGEGIQVAIDESKLPEKGEALGEIKVISVADGSIRSIIPITVLSPDSKNWSASKRLSIKPATVARFFVTKPTGAKQLLVSAQEDNGNLCGYFQVHGPLGQRLSPIDATLAAGYSRRELAFLAPLDGMYEVVLTGMGSHTICPKTQEVTLQTQWIGLSLTAEDVTKTKNQLTLQLGVQNASAIPIEGSFVVEKASEVEFFTLKPSATIKGFYTGNALKLSGGEFWSVDESALQSQFFGLPSFDLYLKSAVKDADRRRDLSVSLNPGSWTQQPEIFKEKVGTEFTPQLALFEYGSTGSTQGNITLKLRRELATDSYMTLNSVHYSYVSGYSRVAISGPLDFEKSPSGVRTFLCGFKPAGFQTKVPCGDLTLAY